MGYLSKPVRQSQLYNALITAMDYRNERRVPQPPVASQLPTHTVTFTGRILLAEDNVVNQIVTVGMLESLGCRVDCVDNGQAALADLTRTAYDLVLMDCQMPVMDGLEATQALRAREASGTQARLPVVALTAHALEGDREQCLAAGMDDYLSKPFSLNQLRDVLSRWLPTHTAAPAVPPPSASSAVPTVKALALPAGHLDPGVLDRIQALQQPGRPDVLSRVLQGYLTASRELMGGLRNGVTQNDATALWQAAHTLKSSSHNVGALALAAQYQEMERIGRTHSLEHAAERLRAIETEYAAVCEELAAYLQRRDAAGQTEAPVLEPASATPTGVAATLLLVDDEPTNLDLLQAMLEPDGYRLLTATNGNEALERVRRDRPDVVLLDLMMPDLDGFEVCRRLKTTGPWQTISIIILTALDRPEDYARAFEYGADDFMTKPVDATMLLDRVRDYLRARHFPDAF